MYNAGAMQTKTILPVVLCLLLAGCAATKSPSVYIGVVIDNHEDAREHQRGLEEALLVQEYLVEGYITRFVVIFDIADLPDSVGPIRSVRPYFLDGSSPLISAIFHVGGSPEALEKIQKSNSPVSFNALKMDSRFDYDADAPAPHNRFLTREQITTLLADHAMTPVAFPFASGSVTTGEPATSITVNHYSRIHNVTYGYDPKTQTYAKTSDDTDRPPSPSNLIILEAPVRDTGILGRLDVTMNGTGSMLLFRNGMMQKGEWSKSDDDHFFAFSDDHDQLVTFNDGQVWMIILDSLTRVSWNSDQENKDRE